MRRLAVLAAATSLLFTASFVSGAPATASTLEVIAYEGFDYPDGFGVDLLDGASGGDGWTTDWVWDYSAGSSLQVGTGLSYPNLTVSGNSATTYIRSGGNEIAQLTRNLPNQNQGVVYIQFLTTDIGNPNSGGGTPTLRFTTQGAGSFALGGNGKGDGTVMGLLDGSLDNQLIASQQPLSATNLLTVVRIDHTLNRTSLWTNPDLSSFDYTDPPSPDGFVNQSFDFDQINIFLRRGFVDEIKIMRLLDSPIPEDPDQRPPDWIQQYARSADDTCATEWTPSWAQWPNEGGGGFVCTRVLTWSHEQQGFVLAD